MKYWKDLEKHGRHGDTMMKKIDGEPAHVNAVEYEMSPEYIKEHGSGTINPVTGKREYFIPLLVAGVALAGAGLNYMKNKKENEAKGDAITAAEGVKDEQLDLAQRTTTAAANTQQMNVGFQTTGATSNILNQTNSTISKSNMATSTATAVQDTMMGGVINKSDTQNRDIVSTRNLKMEGAEGQIEKEFQATKSANAPKSDWAMASEAFGAGVSSGSSVIGVPSDRDLKKNIKRVGKSKSGIPIYTFKFKNPKKYGHGTYRGTMADKVPKSAVIKQGKYDIVDYSKIDVDYDKIGV